MPCVDILMATYNGQDYIREQIESLKEQTFKDWRLLISDDCSNDGTLDIVDELQKDDSRIHVISQETRYGSSKANFMSMLPAVSSPYAMFCDQDDVWLPTKIATSLERIQSLEKKWGRDTPLCVFTDLTVVDQNLKTIAESFEHRDGHKTVAYDIKRLVCANVAAGCTMLFNKTLVDLLVRDYSIDRILMHDWWALLVCVALGHASFIDEPLILYRQHEHNVVGARHLTLLERIATLRSRKGERLQYSRDTALEPELILELYGDLLEIDVRNSLSNYVDATYSTSSIRAILLLQKSGCVTSGLSRLTQALNFWRLAKANRMAVFVSDC